VERYWCPRGRLRGRRRFTRGGGALRGRCWNLLKNFLVGGLEFGDLAHHLILTGGQLIDTFSHVGKVPLDGLSHRGNIRLYLLYLLRVEGGSGGRYRRDHLGRSLSNRWRPYSISTSAF
jgi:hypothetical protein